MSSRLRARAVAAVAAAALVAALLATTSVADAAAASPRVTGPIPGDPVITQADFDLTRVGYTMEEFFLEGTAEAYEPVGPLTSDGRWTVRPFARAPYRTRIVVERPVDPADFNGTVVVEWLNVSGSVDGSAAWLQMQAEIHRHGYAWVGVSAQEVGLITGTNATQKLDPVRYASMLHPGDSYSYDMFSQAGQALRDNAELIFGGLQPERFIPIGESQSGSRLRTYINAVHPLVRVYDGFLPSVSASASPLSQAPLPDVPIPEPVHIRDDLDVPVIFVQSEREVQRAVTSGNRQGDSDHFREWEIAGSAHFDQYGLQIVNSDYGEIDSVEAWFNAMLNPTANPSPNFSCAVPINTGPRTFVMRAALRAITDWVATGTPAPEADRIEIADPDPDTFAYAVDAHGNVRGGIRTPAVDAPVAKLSGLPQPGPGFCGIFGLTVPLTSAELRALYGSHGGFVSAWVQATNAAVDAGFLLEDDAEVLRIVAAQSEQVRGALAGPLAVVPPGPSVFAGVLEQL